MKADEMFRAWFVAAAGRPNWADNSLCLDSVWQTAVEQNVEICVRVYRQFQDIEAQIRLASTERGGAGNGGVR